MQSVQSQLHQINSQLAQASSSDRVQIIPDGNEIRLEVHTVTSVAQMAAHMWQIASHITSFFNNSACEAAPPETTKIYFKNVFGEKRVERLQKRYGFSLEHGAFREFNPSRYDIETLFIGVATTTKEDIKELIEELQGENNIRFCTADESIRLRDRFKGKTVADCSKEDLDLLISILVPFNGTDCLIGEVPKLDLHDQIPFSTFEMQRQTAYVLKMTKESTWSDTEWANSIAKRIGSRDPEAGTIIPHPKGYYEVLARLQENGACAFLLSPLNSALQPVVLFRGTRVVFPCDLKDPKAVLESLKEDLFEEIGRWGIMSLHNTLRDYITKPDLGFIRDEQQKIWGIGYSLGGTHIQRSAVLFPERFDRITTTGSPGIDKESAQLYAEMMKEKRCHATITHVVDQGDIVPHFGDCHLGFECIPEHAHATFLFYRPEESEPAVSPLILSFLSKIPGTGHIEHIAQWAITTRYAHFKTAHTRRHRVFSLPTTQGHISHLLQEIEPNGYHHGEYFESIRKRFFSLRTNVSFTAFAKHQNQRH